MQHALFLDKPIRSNPRRRAQESVVSMLPSPPCETASPARSVPLRPTSAHDPDAQSTSTTEMSTTEHMAIIASITRPRWDTDTASASASPISPAYPKQASEGLSATPGPSQQRTKERRKLTKAACSSCRQRKSKVRRHISSSDLPLSVPPVLYFHKTYHPSPACRTLSPRQQDLTLSQCDGKRPTCSTCRTKSKTCEYMTEEGVSSQSAYKTRLEDYATVLQLLKRANSPECALILEDLRGPKGVVDGVKEVLDKWVEHE